MAIRIVVKQRFKQCQPAFIWVPVDIQAGLENNSLERILTNEYFINCVFE
jgi:hypothetical protein